MKLVSKQQLPKDFVPIREKQWCILPNQRLESLHPLSKERTGEGPQSVWCNYFSDRLEKGATKSTLQWVGTGFVFNTAQQNNKICLPFTKHNTLITIVLQISSKQPKRVIENKQCPKERDLWTNHQMCNQQPVRAVEVDQ